MVVVIVVILFSVIAILAVGYDLIAGGHRGAPTGSQLPPPPKPKPSGPWYFVVQYEEGGTLMTRVISADCIRSYKICTTAKILIVLTKEPALKAFKAYENVYRYGFLQASELGGIFLDEES